MADEDVLEQARAAGLTIATGVARLGDTFIRAAQQRAEADVRDKQLQVEDAQRRYEAQAQVAEQLYRRAADPDWMRSVDQAEAIGVWEAAQLWADFHSQVDPLSMRIRADGTGQWFRRVDRLNAPHRGAVLTSSCPASGATADGASQHASATQSSRQRLDGTPTSTVKLREVRCKPGARMSDSRELGPLRVGGVHQMA